MRRRNQDRAAGNDQSFARQTFFKHSVGGNHQPDAAREQHQRRDIAVKPQKTGQNTDERDEDRNADKNIFDALVREKAEPDERKRPD